MINDNYQRPDEQVNESFTFLGYSFQTGKVKSKIDKRETVVGFGADISNNAKRSVSAAIKEVLRPQWRTQNLEWFAKNLNPKIRGWINYYTSSTEMRHTVYFII